MPKAIDLTGKRFGRLTVLSLVEDHRHGTYWLCRCDCGNEKVIKGQSLREGLTKSCGCFDRETKGSRASTHGLSKTRLYRIWVNMHRRCEYEKNGGYSYCGARGITVCEEWESFEPFRDWALANGYKDNLTIDRVDNSIGYMPSNCRWVTMKVQENNSGEGIMRIDIQVAPATKKNSNRIVKARGRYMVLPSKRYADFEKACKEYMPILKEPINYPVNICCIYYMPTRRRVDLVNLQEATLDILVKYGVLSDDNSNIVVSMDGSRVLYDKENPRTEVTIKPVTRRERIGYFLLNKGWRLS